MSPTFSITTEIDPNQVLDLICAAFDYGISYWAEIDEYKIPDDADRSWLKDPTFWEPGKVRQSYLAPLLGGYVRLSVYKEEDNVTLNAAALRNGLELLCKKHPEHWASFMTGNADADTSDVFIQLCVFGEVIYG